MKGQLSSIRGMGVGFVVLAFCGQAAAQPGPGQAAATPPDTPAATATPTGEHAEDAATSTAEGESPAPPDQSAAQATEPAPSVQPDRANAGEATTESTPPTAVDTAAASPQEPDSKGCRGHEYSGPPTLLGGGVSVGGYGGVVVAYSRFDGDDGVLVGGEGALLLGHRFSIGGAGYGWVSEHESVEMDGIAHHMEVGYGGLVLRYAFLTNQLVYLSAGALIGGGAVVMVPDDTDRWDDDVDEDDTDRFFVVEPQLSAHANVTRWMRVGLQAGYRMTAGISKFGREDSSMHGPVVGGTLQFGWL